MDTGKDVGGRTHLQKDSLQILDLQGLAFSVLKSCLIFLSHSLCTLPPTTGFTMIQYIHSLFALLQCRCIDLVEVFDTILTSRQMCEKLQCLYEGTNVE